MNDLRISLSNFFIIIPEAVINIYYARLAVLKMFSIFAAVGLCY
jgi:hypothetical protein